jgi:hypothetical protein
MTRDQKSLLRKIIGGPNLKLTPGYEFSEVVLILGARSGKSRVVSAIAAYESCCRDWKPYLQKGELAWCFVIATREQQAIDIGRNMIATSIRSSPILREMIVDDVSEAQKSLFPRSKAGVLVLKTGMAVTALPCSSRVGRGYPIGCVVYDEMAYFARENKNESTDRGIYESILPRQAQFEDPYTGDLVAKTFIISTPADRTGLLWERYRDREKGDNRKLYFCIKAPTWKIRTDFSSKIMENLKKRAGAGFKREFGAEFVDTVSPFITKRLLEPSLRQDETPPPIDTDTHIYYIGIDAAFGERDRFGIAVGHSEDIIIEDGGEKKESFKVTIDVAQVIDSHFDKDMVDTAVEVITHYCNKYDTWQIKADQYQADAFGKLLEQNGIYVEVENWTTALHRKLYNQLRSLLLRRGISLPNNSELIEEILGLQIKFMSTSGQFTIGHRVAGHDDVSDAVALVVGDLWVEEDSQCGVDFI